MINIGQKIHTRQINIATYEGTDDSVIVEGILQDERLIDMYLATGEFRSPGTYHHMIIKMKVTIPRLIIMDIEVEMPTVPQKACRETQKCLDLIKGLHIVSGFAAKVRGLIGGTKGCYHLLSLLTAMAPAAVQGSWNRMSKEPLDPETYLPMAIETMKNTCWLWREDGPLIIKIRGINDAEPND